MTMPAIKYKMRAECPRDIGEFLKEVRVHTITAEHIVAHRELPDMVAEFTSPWTLDQIKEAIAKIDDGHVMLETVALHAEYTGERN